MEWINSTNIYEVNLRQYTEEGTINAFVQHLPRLKDMGVDTLWFMPITPIAQKNKKGTLGSYYACSDYTSVSPEFGTMDDWKIFVSTAHTMGFKVIMDWVANHTGWDHVWTKQHPEWYQRDEQTGDFKKASGMDDIIELNFDLPAVRKAMIDAMAFWIKETDIDGFRCDLAFWVQLDFWVEAKAELQKVKPLFWLGELDPLDHPEYMKVFDAAYTWQWMHKTREFYTQHQPAGVLKKVLDDYRNAPGIKTWFTANHDENSWNGTEYEKYGDMALQLAVFSCTWPGIPLVYSGQEIPNKKRLQFFEKDVINWGHCELHDFYKQLFSLKRNDALYANATLQIIETGIENILAYKRASEDNEFIVLLNFSSGAAAIHLNLEHSYQNVFSGEVSPASDLFLPLQPWGWIVLQKK